MATGQNPATGLCRPAEGANNPKPRATEPFQAALVGQKEGFAMFLRVLTTLGALMMIVNACGPVIQIAPSSDYEVVALTAE